MAVDDLPLDDKAKRMRDLLSSFYAPDPSMSANASSAKFASLEAINTPSFDPDQYMNLLVQKSNLEGLLQRHVEMAAEIKNLDTDLQMLVYENYNKFISATDTIKRMKNNIVGMEANMEQLLEKIMSVQSRSDGVNTSLFEKREHIEKLHRTRNLLRKVQFIYDLPTRLGKCIKSEAYADAVKFFTGAMPIFKAYGDSSFQDCKRASEEAMAIIIKNLQEKLFSDSEGTEARAEAVVLLKQLDFPVDKLKTYVVQSYMFCRISIHLYFAVDSLKAKLLENLEHFHANLQLESREVDSTTLGSDEPSKLEKFSDSVPVISHEASTNKGSMHEFAEAVRAYRVIFPDSEKQLIELARDLFTKHFETIQKQIKKKISSADLLGLLRVMWTDVILMDEVLPEAALPDFSLEAAHVAVRQYVASTFVHLLHDVSEALTRVQTRPMEGMEEECSLQVALEASKKAVIQGSMDVLLDFRQLLDYDLDLLVKLRDLFIDWVQEGFQDFFRTLDDNFLLLSGIKNSTSQDQGLIDGTLGEKVLAGLVLVLAQLSVFIEQNAIPRITEARIYQIEIAAAFSGGGVRGSEYGPAFVPGEMCRMFRSAGEKFLHLLEAIGIEVKQILPRGLIRKHRRSDSNGSTTSSRSNPMREDKMNRSNTQRARSHLLETHLAKLFKQKLEIFTKVEYTQVLVPVMLVEIIGFGGKWIEFVCELQESVASTIVKLCLKSLQEFVRLHTFNRSGFQQIQLDIQFLRAPLKEIVEDEASVDFLLDEVIVAAVERCLDPIPLEPAILDKLIQAKLAKSREQNPSSS
ncbi:hypothetical protein HHK36_020877 [Tetracentron sinense]|uniref:Vacuolar protein sorting-associated protein 51 homolog n=1 Tax=Tetracentron sinense TaxID=13715 RepID=A0A834YXU9_TETSI|nr:hypothetical protein HHK36_020877 [Tetracentron sinense]